MLVLFGAKWIKNNETFLIQQIGNFKSEEEMDAFENCKTKEETGKGNQR